VSSVDPSSTMTISVSVIACPWILAIASCTVLAPLKTGIRTEICGIPGPPSVREADDSGGNAYDRAALGSVLARQLIFGAGGGDRVGQIRSTLPGSAKCLNWWWT